MDFEHAGRGDAPQGALGVQFDGGDHLALFLASKEGLGDTNSEDAKSEEITKKFETPLGASINKDVFVLILNFLNPKERLLYRLNREFQSPRSILRRDRYTLHRDRLRFLGYELRVCTAIGCTRWRSPWSLSHACVGCASPEPPWPVAPERSGIPCGSAHRDIHKDGEYKGERGREWSSWGLC